MSKHKLGYPNDFELPSYTLLVSKVIKTVIAVTKKIRLSYPVLSVTKKFVFSLKYKKDLFF